MRPRKILPVRFPKTLMLDTGYWYALCDPADAYRDQVEARAVERHDIILPWPCLYETLRTRFVRNSAVVGRFRRLIAGPTMTLLDDAPYRDHAFERVLQTAARRPMSLVDVVMRAMIEDVNVRVDCFLTFNEKDFFDVCRRRGIPMRYGAS